MPLKKMKSLFPVPPVSSRRRFVELIEEGKAKSAVEILVDYYEMPHDIDTLTPEDMLKKDHPFFITAFEFPEGKDLAKKYPEKYKEYLEITERGITLRRVAWVVFADPDFGILHDQIIVSEKYFKHPAPFLHEFHHIHSHYSGVPFPNGARITEPGTWDIFTRRFLLGTGWNIPDKVLEKKGGMRAANPD
jgi:hypothetical protein